MEASVRIYLPPLSGIELSVDSLWHTMNISSRGTFVSWHQRPPGSHLDAP